MVASCQYVSYSHSLTLSLSLSVAVSGCHQLRPFLSVRSSVRLYVYLLQHARAKTIQFHVEGLDGVTTKTIIPDNDVIPKTRAKKNQSTMADPW